MSDFLDVKLAHMIEDAATRRAANLVPLVTALDRIALLEAALKAVEWGLGYECPKCHRLQLDGHAPDCIVGKALKP